MLRATAPSVAAQLEAASVLSDIRGRHDLTPTIRRSKLSRDREGAVGRERSHLTQFTNYRTNPDPRAPATFPAPAQSAARFPTRRETSPRPAQNAPERCEYETAAESARAGPRSTRAASIQARRHTPATRKEPRSSS